MAGPFRHMHDENTSSIYSGVFSIASIILTCFTRRLVLGYVLRSPPPPAAVKERLKVIPSIPRFVLCTILTLANTIALVLTAFAIQAFLHCGSELTEGTRVPNRQQRKYAVCFWYIYGFISIGWATTGVLCWPIWARNLWDGEEAAEKWPNNETSLPGLVIFCAFSSPIVLVGFISLVVMIILVALAKEAWVRVRGKPVVMVNLSAAERGIGRKSSGSSVTVGSVVTQVENVDEKT
jgi:hypothetical protein